MVAPYPRPPRRRRARAAALIGLWTVAVIGATLVGLSAVGAIGTGIVTSGPHPLTRAEIDSRLATPTNLAPLPTSDPTGGVATSPARVIAAGPAGTVGATCVAGTPRVLSVSPAQGFQASDEPDSDTLVKITFKSDQTKVKVRLSCTDGNPTALVEVEQE